MPQAVTYLEKALSSIRSERSVHAVGRVKRFDGQIIHASAFPASVGQECRIYLEDGSWAEAEVIGFLDEYTVLVLTGGKGAIVAGAKVETVKRVDLVPCGNGLLGRVFDGAGNALDGLPEPILQEKWPLRGERVNPLRRRPVKNALDTGVRAINALLTLGIGQRIGIIAGSGVGKSSLLSTIARYTTAEVVVIGLIGERGREVSGFVEELQASPSFAHTILVAVPHAQRELGLALGEHPTAKGYPPSVISLIGSLLERAGLDGDTGGSITAIYTVLADGDDTTNDPVVDTARAILDGHIVLARKQAEQGIYPAIDLGASISRTMSDCVTPGHMTRARKFRRYLSLWEQNRDLVLLGGYQSGQDEELDQAFAIYPQLLSFITQSMHESSGLVESEARLQSLFP